MKEINSVNYGDQLDFTFTLLTSSENVNDNVFKETLYTTREADMQLTGKSGEQSFTYSNITHGMSNFTQTYQIEKFGVSTIDEVSLEIRIPTHVLYNGNLIRMVQLYAPEGYHANQPIVCSSDVVYIVENVVNDFTSDLNVDDVKGSDESYISTTTEGVNEHFILDNNNVFPLNPHLKRKQRDLKLDDGILYPLNRTLFVNCSHPHINYICGNISCTIGPFKGKQQSAAALQLKMLINVSSISELLGKKDIILFATDGHLTITNPKGFIQNGIRPDAVHVASTFIGETVRESVATWIIVAAAVAGLLLLLLLIMALVKAGFFHRKKKEELAALKEAEEVKHFQGDEAQDEINDDEMNFEVENSVHETKNNLDLST